MEILLPNLEKELAKVLEKAVSGMFDGKTISQSLTKTAQTHVARRFPGSQHWSPAKISVGAFSSKGKGETVVDIPGAGRAYHDVDIWPKSAKYLTIPMVKNASSYGSSTFVVAKKNGKKFIAANVHGKLAFLYFLALHVHQPQDSSLMPADRTFVSGLAKALKKKK